MASQPRLSANSRSAGVFFSEGWGANENAGEIDALAFAQHAAVNDIADNFCSRDLVDAQLDESVGEQDARALFNVFRQGFERSADERGGAQHVARRDCEPVTGLQEHRLMIFEQRGANLGPLQITQNA